MNTSLEAGVTPGFCFHSHPIGGSTKVQTDAIVGSVVMRCSSIRWSFWVLSLVQTAGLFLVSRLPWKLSGTYPSTHARLRRYWVVLNECHEGRDYPDLEEMKAKGFGGAVIVDGQRRRAERQRPVPHGPTFFFARVARALQTRLARGRIGLGLEMSSISRAAGISAARWARRRRGQEADLVGKPPSRVRVMSR